ncbi:hypothetical protein [Moorena sp. SIO3I6]|uniref:hypothetical protein n=1 Tax=Moorena sp. SIO3I6 TaxID=2607831 RepID=UPI0025D86101|nr:hypothetical protein [Moorena sp. SIO3I6]
MSLTILLIYHNIKNSSVLFPTVRCSLFPSSLFLSILISPHLYADILQVAGE